jgi:hypothetical protein
MGGRRYKLFLRNFRRLGGEDVSCWLSKAGSLIRYRGRRIGKQLCSTRHALGINIEAMFFMLRPRVWMEAGKRGDRSWSLRCAGCFCVILSLAICFAGCGERSQDLEERVTQLQKELNRTQDELRNTKQALDATNEELARLKAASTNASTAAPVAPNNASAPASGASVSGVQPAPAQQSVARSAGIPADRSVTIQWPGGSGAPASANQNAPPPARGNAAGASAQQSGATGPGGGGANNRTVVIQWPNNNGAAPSTNQPSAPSGAANPPARGVPQPASSATGRSDRTVIIQWPDSGQSPPPRN